MQLDVATAREGLHSIVKDSYLWTHDVTTHRASTHLFKRYWPEMRMINVCRTLDLGFHGQHLYVIYVCALHFWFYDLYLVVIWLKK